MTSAAKQLQYLSVTCEASPPLRCFSQSACLAGQPPKDDTWLPPTTTFWPHQHQWHDKYCKQRNIMQVGPRRPALATDVWVAPSAVVAGDVDIFDGVCSRARKADCTESIQSDSSCACKS